METTKSKSINFSNLSIDQLLELQKQIADLNRLKSKERADNIEAYKAIVDQKVKEVAPALVAFGKLQNQTVNHIFAEFTKALELKKELYAYKDTQSSHSFSARDGSASVIIGYNEIIGFDGTENVGVCKIREFITTLAANDSNRLVLVGLLETFMKPNKKGELNPMRVAELYAQKEQVNNELFSEGVDIIMKAQFKSRTTTFVKGWHKNVLADGQEQKVEFTISTKV